MLFTIIALHQVFGAHSELCPFKRPTRKKSFNLVAFNHIARGRVYAFQLFENSAFPILNNLEVIRFGHIYKTFLFAPCFQWAWRIMFSSSQTGYHDFGNIFCCCYSNCASKCIYWCGCGLCSFLILLLLFPFLMLLFLRDSFNFFSLVCCCFFWYHFSVCPRRCCRVFDESSSCL